ncbi:MAG: flagellar basal body rod protein FlgB [Aquabacterium sp.]
MQRLSDTLNFQAQALVLRAERHRLLASNIANADTPGYKARDMDFGRALREATGAAGPGGAPALAATRPGHLAAAIGARSEPNLLYALPAQDNLDGNTVDMDRERAAAGDNAVRYEATLRFINGSVKSLLDAMKSHNQG